MTEYNAASVIMSLDEYYDKCVVPKPNIPKSYVSSSKNKSRKAGHLCNYKELDLELEENEEDENDEFSESICNQLKYETDDFDQIYDTVNNGDGEKKSQAAVEPPRESTQWRIKGNNVNRPSGAPPLVPKHVMHTPAKVNQQHTTNSHWGGGANQRKQWRRGNINKPKNIGNRNGGQTSVQQRLGVGHGGNVRRPIPQPAEQGLRAAFNMFGNNDSTNGSQPQQVLMNIQNHFKNSNQSRINLSSALGSLNINNNPITNSLPSCLSSANNISNGWNIHQPNRRLINDPLSNLCNDLPYSRLANSSLEPNRLGINHMPPLASQPNDSLSLADLMQLDRISRNVNVDEVARNALLLLNSVVHKPVLDASVQQELSEIQNVNGQPSNSSGLGFNMSIKPQTTDVSMYQRFK